MNTLQEVLCGYYIDHIDQITPESLSIFKNKDIIALLKQVQKGNVDNLPEAYRRKIEQYRISFLNYEKEQEHFSLQELILKIKEESLNYKCYSLVDDLFFKFRPIEYMQTDFKNYNYYLTGGFQKKTWIGIEGKTGTGKTTMMLSFTTDLLKKGHNVCYINLEMNEEALAYLLFSSLTGISYTYIRDNYYKESCREQIISSLNSMELGDFRQILNPEFGRLSIKELEEILLLEEEKIGKKFDVIIIDYLYLLNAAEEGFKSEQGYEKQMRLSQDAHKMAQRNNWCVISVFQKNRQGETAGAFAAQFDMDYYFTFERLEEQDLVKVTPVKTRGFDGKRDDFFLEYDSVHRIYKEAEKPFESYKWQDVVDLQIVHENLCPRDIIDLCNANGIKAPSNRDLSLFKNKRNYNYPRGKSSIDYHDINLQELFRKVSEKLQGKNPKKKDVVLEMGTTAEDLFKI